MYRAIDENRDQSYFYYTSEQLDYLRFPLGGMHKDETNYSKKTNLNVADKIAKIFVLYPMVIMHQ